MIPSAELTEKEIIDRVLNGEKRLYEIIIRRFNPYLYKIGRSYNYNHEDTQDLMQDTFVDAYKSLSNFEGRSSFKTWIVRIMLNNCYRKKEKLSFKNEIMKEDINEYASPMFSASGHRTDYIVQNKELGHQIEKALSELPESYREVFSLREINGMSVSETSELLNISEGNVKVRLNRSKTMLREKLQQTYSGQELFEFNLIYCDAMVKRVFDIIDNL